MIFQKNGISYRFDGISYRFDGYYNPSSGYGGEDDNIQNTRYIPDIPLHFTEIESLYDTWLVRRGVDLPVEHRLAKSVDFITDDDDSDSRKNEIKALENDIKQVRMWHYLTEAKKWARLYGGALIYFDYGDDHTFSFQNNLDQHKFINFELKDNQRGIPKKIWLVDRWAAYPASYYREEIHGRDHPKLGQPETYQVTLLTTGYSRFVYAHESRCIIIDGLPLSPRRRAANLMWGQSVVQTANSICKYFEISLKAMADTFEDFNYKSLMIKNLQKLIEEGKWEIIGHQTAYAAKNQHNQNVGVHGEETELKKHTTTVAGLPDMATLMSNFTSSAFHPGIPDSIFFSAKGGALAGTSSENDIRNYFKNLRYIQEHEDRYHIEKFIWLLGRDPEIFPFIFPEMEEQTELQKIEARDKQADVDTKYIGSNVLLPEEIRSSRFNQPEPKLDQVIIDDDLYEMTEKDEETEEEDLQKIREPEKKEEPEERQREDQADFYEISDIFTAVVKED